MRLSIKLSSSKLSVSQGWGGKSERRANHVAARMILERRLCAGRVVPQQRHPMGGTDKGTPKTLGSVLDAVTH
jgi:hypothetical protein